MHEASIMYFSAVMTIQISVYFGHSSNDWYETQNNPSAVQFTLKKGVQILLYKFISVHYIPFTANNQ
jgi:hypothetical protein